GLAVATLVNARDHELPLPAAAFVMSPYADLTLAGTTMETKREVDPLMSREALQARVTDYTAGHDAALGLISPIFADLSGLPPLMASTDRRRSSRSRSSPAGSFRSYSSWFASRCSCISKPEPPTASSKSSLDADEDRASWLHASCARVTTGFERISRSSTSRSL